MNRRFSQTVIMRLLRVRECQERDRRKVVGGMSLADKAAVYARQARELVAWLVLLVMAARDGWGALMGVLGGG